MWERGREEEGRGGCVGKEKGGEGRGGCVGKGKGGEGRGVYNRESERRGVCAHTLDWLKSL